MSLFTISGSTARVGRFFLLIARGKDFEVHIYHSFNTYQPFDFLGEVYVCVCVCVCVFGGGGGGLGRTGFYFIFSCHKTWTHYTH